LQFYQDDKSREIDEYQEVIENSLEYDLFKKKVENIIIPLSQNFKYFAEIKNALPQLNAEYESLTQK
jgi:hypothetical protein